MRHHILRSKAKRFCLIAAIPFFISHYLADAFAQVRKLVKDEELSLANYKAELKPGNKLVITASFKNASQDKFLAQPFSFTVNQLTRNIVASTEPTISLRDLAGIGYLRPGATTAVLTFEVTHKGEPFSYFVDANAAVDNVRDVKALLQRLGDDRVEIREQAQDELEFAITHGLLTKEDRKMILAATRSPDAEVRARAGAVIQAFVNSLPIAEFLKSFKFTFAEDPNNNVVTIKFILAATEFVENDIDKVNKLEDLNKKIGAVRAEAYAGNFDKARQALMQLKAAVESLSADDPFGSQKDQLLDPIKNALDSKLFDLENEYKTQFDETNLGPRLLVDVANPGPANVGKTVSLSIEGLSKPGTLDTTIVSPDFVLSDPPAGFEFVGQVFELTAEDNLLVSGNVTVSIEYGKVQPFGNRVMDPTELQVLRVIGGRIQILDTLFNDLNNFAILASYSADSGTLDQFGQFAVVQPAPAILEQSPAP